MGFRIRRISDSAILTVTPTPMLLSMGGGEAFEKNGILYLREDGTRHVSSDGQYMRVRVEQVEDYRVDVGIHVTGPDATDETYNDYFIVEAVTDTEASHLGMAAAAEDVTYRYGDEYASDVTIRRVRRGVSI